MHLIFLCCLCYVAFKRNQQTEQEYQHNRHDIEKARQEAGGRDPGE
ncbi:MAG: hypothetical protein HQ542_01665 [Bacteroidia bacterium]|nr:hypothetical protein [Bacteroidia bacterium]